MVDQRQAEPQRAAAEIQEACLRRDAEFREKPQLQVTARLPMAGRTNKRLQLRFKLG